MRRYNVESSKHFGSSVASHLHPCYFALNFEPSGRLSARRLVTVHLKAFGLVIEPKA